MQAHSFTGYLESEASDWHDCLENSLVFLRESWAGDWVGLPALLNTCIDFLNLSRVDLSQDATHILLAAKHVALQIEHEYATLSVVREPKYHNRLHVADVLTSMSIQIAIQSTQEIKLNPEWTACALLTVIAHDFGHTGQINRYPSEIELHSVQLLRPILDECKVPAVWREAVELAIVNSDFAIVRKNHEAVQGQDFQCNQEWLNVFLNEADVMASATSKFGYALGESLAEEWKTIDFSAHHSVATPDGRRAFLNQLIFSSTPAHCLLMKECLPASCSSFRHEKNRNSK